ncbi:MAG TPA: M1 family metallopeptidase [Acidobacteriaceae bacterium]
MLKRSMVSAVCLGLALGVAASAQSATKKAPVADTPGSGKTVPLHAEPTKDDLLRGAYGPFRANNDLLFYHLNIRVDPEAKTVVGTNTVRFRMLQDGKRIQLDLAPTWTIESIKLKGEALQYTREERAVWVDFPRTLRQGHVYQVVFAYSGKPVEQGRFGCFTFDKDAAGKPWITTACEEEGASVWWPNKDQWRDEPQEGMEISVAVPNGLMDVSNGRFEGKHDLGDGYTRWDWRVHYGINNYDVALNIGDYQHFGGKHGLTTLDYYVLPEDLDKAKKQFQQVPGMLDAYEHYFGEYPFDKDGYKLIEVPYAGMEHQSAVAYGNKFDNGYLHRDWTYVGISPRFDFIIIHESGHEWFGNAITAEDRSDMWIHEGWTTYLEMLYVEYRWGRADSLLYGTGLAKHAKNQRPIIPERGTNAEPPQDMYFKGALMLNTLRSVIDDDKKWFADIHDFFQHFKYQQIMTEDVVAWWNVRTGMNLTPFFNEYLRHADLPVLELKFDAGTVAYRWKAAEVGFAMPIKVGDPQHWTMIAPVTAEWKTMPWSGKQEDFKVARDLYYVAVSETPAPATPHAEEKK